MLEAPNGEPRSGAVALKRFGDEWGPFDELLFAVGLFEFADEVTNGDVAEWVSEGS